MKLDLTVLAIPGFIGAMAAEYAWQRKHPVAPGTRAGDYEFKDTMASLSMASAAWWRRTSRTRSSRGPSDGAARRPRR